jgi:acetyltransferase-like isoleucine patch superfamily enzyme
MIKKLLVWLLTRYQLSVLYRFRKVGRNVRLDKGLFVYPHRVSLGDDVFIGRYCFLDGDIEIGNGVMLAGSVAIVGGDHVFRQVGMPLFAAPREHWNKTVVGDDAWLGHGATVLNGLTIGRGAIVAAGSVVTHDVPPYAIVAGNPARVIAQRFDTPEQARHEQALRAHRR